MPRILSESSDVQQPYYRLGADYAAKCRRKSRTLGYLNVVLAAVCTIFGLFLLLNLLVPYTGPCCWRGPGSRQFWPFDRPHQVLLISMDGFRHDYLELVRERFGPDALPNFARMEAEGIRANRSINAYPTVTMPNHRTLVTGLYPEDHGVVGNNMFDTKWPNKTFVMGDQDSLNEAPWLDSWPDPIWVTLQQRGGLAGSMLWPLTDNFVHNDLPFQQVSQFSMINGASIHYSFSKRVRDLLWWLQNPRYRLDLVLAYFPEPDETGHAFGPESIEVANMVVDLDKTLGQLLDGLEERGIRDEVDIILTADHGMSAISRERFIPLDDFVSPNDYTYTQLSTLGFIYPVPGKEEEVYTKLHDAHPHLKVYRRSETPASLHFNHTNSRMPPLVLVPDPLWHLVHTLNDSVSAGNHGYTPEFAEMNAFFIASGPSFRKRQVVEQVHAVDVYALMCGLLRLHPNPHNGSLERIAQDLLKPDVAERLLAFDRWPRWFFWFAVELELLWLLMAVTLFLLLAVTLGISLRMQRKYSRLAVHSADQYDSKEAIA